LKTSTYQLICGLTDWHTYYIGPTTCSPKHAEMVRKDWRRYMNSRLRLAKSYCERKLLFDTMTQQGRIPFEEKWRGRVR